MPPEFSVRSDSVDVDQIMKQLRARIREKRGVDYTEEDLHRISNRIITMTHEFNAARGIGRETEKLPEWVTDKPMEDEEGLTFPQDEMVYMLGEYYELRGWGELPPREQADGAFGHLGFDVEFRNLPNCELGERT